MCLKISELEGEGVDLNYMTHNALGDTEHIFYQSSLYRNKVCQISKDLSLWNGKSLYIQDKFMY